MKNYQAILIVLISYGIVYGMLNGTIQNYVHFAGELNEMFTFIMAFMMGTISLFAIDYKKILKALI
jgi:membrane protein CcdC involved in cytochrome C biogenesis